MKEKKHFNLSELEMISHKKGLTPNRQSSHVESMLCDREFVTAKKVHEKKNERCYVAM